MGKSTVSTMFKSRCVPIWDADAEVHNLYRSGGEAAEAVGALFPDAVNDDGSVDRRTLAEHVVGRDEQLERLEQALAPLLERSKNTFLSDCELLGESVVVLDIPLLFERNMEKDVDAVVVVACFPDEQRRRVLARPGMTKEKFEYLLSRQIPDKVSRADYVIDTSGDLIKTEVQVDSILRKLM